MRPGSCGRAARLLAERYRAVLLPVGFTRAYVSARLRELLPHDFTLGRKAHLRAFRACLRGRVPEVHLALRRTQTASQLSLPSEANFRPVCFCGTFLRVAPTGRYPAPNPVKPGLSSRSLERAAAQRTPPAYDTRSRLLAQSRRRGGAAGENRHRAAEQYGVSPSCFCPRRLSPWKDRSPSNTSPISSP